MKILFIIGNLLLVSFGASAADDYYWKCKETPVGTHCVRVCK